MNQDRQARGCSKRAQILTRVLEWFNQGRCEDHDSWMLFGSMGSEIGGEAKILVENDPTQVPFQQILGISEFTVERCSMQGARRLRVGRRNRRSEASKTHLAWNKDLNGEYSQSPTAAILQNIWTRSTQRKLWERSKRSCSARLNSARMRLRRRPSVHGKLGSILRKHIAAMFMASALRVLYYAGLL